ncbi:MAG: prepilin-type N-terminal cleavage/methylation domain-containing protein [Candidatus Pacebacteria bacterium]|nr:prepilin-type N-terminal cleavage/methylation domain-containing protein [Candidatus Paceibacterota bacterium]MBP9818996.1 prepilin-type N-terminal cleavage/methylation domain-containing protein [Candidatus Paceibacterota bacterium]
MRILSFKKINSQKVSRKTGQKGVQSGFSLPELIIVIAIFVIISSIAMFNQSKLSSSVLLTNMGYEVGLAVREAQIYGIGVRSEDLGTSFTGQYGAHFSVADGQERQVIVFADLDTNFAYTPDHVPPEEKYIYEFDNRRGNKIAALCVGNITVPDETCDRGVSFTSPGTESLDGFDILFKRPNPSALIYGPDTSGATTDAVAKTGRAYIVVSSVDGDDCRVVIIESTGQIRVEDSSRGNCQKLTN